MTMEILNNQDNLNNTEAEVYVFPASFAQKRLWFLEQLEPNTGFYNLPLAARLCGDLDISVLEQSFQEIIQRHEALRTALITVNGEPVQAIAPSVTLNIPVVDLQYLPEQEREIQAQKLAAAEAQKPFILSECPLLRVKLLRLSKQEHILVLTMHHTISDGWSIGILLKEIATVYQAFLADQPSPLAELPLQYADYSVWQQEWLQTVGTNGRSPLEEQLSYWKQQLDGVTTLQLPTDRPRTLLQTYQGTTHTWKIPQDLAQKLIAFSQQAGVTLFMTLLTAFNTLLYRYTGQDDIVVGSAIANRNWAESESIVGMFVNTLAFRTTINANPSFQELLDKVRDTTLAAYAHQDLPFEKLVEELQIERDLSRNPLFQVWFGLHNQPMPTLQLGDLTLTPISVDSGTTQFDLSLDIYIEGQELTAAIEYSTELFESATIARMVEHFHTLLYGIVANPQAKLSELPLLTENEKQQLLFEWNNTQTKWEQDLCIHQLVELQAEKTPDAVAVVFEQQQLTYYQLNQRANKLATELQQLGVKPEVLVGICVERSLDMIVGLLAILKAGGAYLPLDPAYPQERLALMLEDAQVSVLITQQELQVKLPKHQAKFICIDKNFILDKYYSNPISKTTSKNLAYVIYTSGSTGKPKGVTIQHKSVANYVYSAIREYDINAGDRILQFASLNFDTSAEEIFPCLASGATLLLRNDEMIGSISQFLHKCKDWQLTVLDLPTAYWHELTHALESENLKLPASIRLVIIGGEKALPERVATWHRCVDSSVRLVNTYGPTEATIVTTKYELSALEKINYQSTNIPIGKPIHNAQTYILDSYMQLVPVGIPGELYIGGYGLSRGYLNRPELTAEKFIINPFINYQSPKIYKTGDLVRYLPDGNIEYLGRIDNQVKIRGFRIELGEIEAALRQNSAVKETVVLLSDNHSSYKRLIAYIVPKEKQEINKSNLRNFLKAKLPAYMLPAAFITLDELPLTPNGKIDKQALLKTDYQVDSPADLVYPCNLVEELLVKIWSQVLGIEKISVNDNFFELGGDSILSIQVVAKANQQGLKLAPKQLFQYQTIAELAAVVDTNQIIQAEQDLVTGVSPLTPIQNWFFEENSTELHHYNQANLLVCKTDIKPELLQQVVQHLLLQHDALRSRFIKTESGWQQIIANPDSEVPFTQIDLSNLSPQEQQSQITVIAAQLQASLNLSTGPLVRVALFNLGINQASRLLFIIHHLVVDGVSWRILLEDFQTAYTQLSQGQSIQLSPKTTSFKHWARQLVEYGQSTKLQQELDYWLTQSQKKVSPLPVDYPAGVNTVESASTISIGLNKTETQALLQEIPIAYHTQINEVLLTALGQAIINWTGEKSVLIDLEGHGRESLFSEVDSSRTVGWFTSVFPVALDLGEIDNIIETLKLVKEQIRCIPNQGIGYGLLRYCSTEDIALQLRTAPQAEICFNYLGQFDAGMAESSILEMANESSGSVQSPLAVRSYLIEINCLIANNQLQIDWSYSKEIHHHSTIENLAQEFVKNLRSLISHCQSPDTNIYTPSDFSAAKIGQKDLEKLLSKLNKVK